MTDSTSVTPQAAHTARVGWYVRVVMYVLLLLSAGTTFLVGGRLWAAARSGNVPVWTPLVPAVAFTAFVGIYSVDRWLLVRRRNFPPMRAFFQVAAAIVFLTLLWPRQASELRAVRDAAPSATVRLLSYHDAAVRSAACELVGLRHEIAVAATVADMAQHDFVPEVRAACAKASEQLRITGEAVVPE